MIEDHAKDLIEKYKDKLFGWNVTYPLPEWACVWLEYWEKLDVLHEKYKDYVYPENLYKERSSEEKDYIDLSQLYFYRFIDLFWEYRFLHPDEFINEEYEKMLVEKYNYVMKNWKRVKYPLPE